jgi:zinc transporter ZupT
MLLGLWTMVFLFLGFPSTWDKIFAIVAGFLIVIISYKMGPRIKMIESSDISYVEDRNDSITNINTKPTS